MSNLIILDGTSSIWKNKLIEYINNDRTDSTVIQKISNREPRQSDKNTDLLLKKDEDISIYNLDYYYNFAGKQYGCTKKQIDDALASYKNVFIVIRNQTVINQVKQDYKKHNVFVVFIYSDMDSISEVFSLDKDPVLERSIILAQEDYYCNPDLYDLVTINGNNKTDFIRIVEHMIKSANNAGQHNSGLSYFSTVLIPIICSVPIGILVNILTGVKMTRWSILAFVLSIAVVTLLIIILIQSILRTQNNKH